VPVVTAAAVAATVEAAAGGTWVPAADLAAGCCGC